MTVNEAIKLLTYGTAYEIQGAYSGKIYHKSYMNSRKNLDKYANMEVLDAPFYTDIRIRGSKKQSLAHSCNSDMDARL